MPRVADSLTVVYLVRHAHTEWRDDDERPLSEAGRRASVVLAQRLDGAPIAAIYSSESPRALQTIAPLADRLGLPVIVVPDLRERELPAVPPCEFSRLVVAAWQHPEGSPHGGESNLAAQRRGLAALTAILDRHQGRSVVISTHGNLLALLLNGLDAAYGYEFWRELSFPDAYRLTFEASMLRAVHRVWDDNGEGPNRE